MSAAATSPQMASTLAPALANPLANALATALLDPFVRDVETKVNLHFTLIVNVV